MPRYIVKPDPVRDLYVEFSTVVEEIVAWGSRQDYLNDGEDVERLDRADKTGSSAHNGHGAWRSEQVIYDQRGFVSVKDFATIVDRYVESGYDADISDLIEPFEDD